MGIAPEEDDRVLLELDSRGRISLGALAGDSRRFLARVDELGQIVLTPAVVMTVTEANLLANPQLDRQIEGSFGLTGRQIMNKIREAYRRVSTDTPGLTMAQYASKIGISEVSLHAALKTARQD